MAEALARGLVVGKYQLDAELGSGGMGAVWLGVNVESGKRCAVKILHHEYVERDDIVQRFFNEARAAGAVSDPGIVEIFDFGYTHDGRAYIVMELLDGESLDARLRAQVKLPVLDALVITRAVAASLGSAHARGIVHRDLKPDNVFLSRDPAAPNGERVKLLDFGIAKLEWSSNVVTKTNAVMGTPMYMSPEQCRGAADINHRSDVYSIGCLLFALLAGYPPFYAEQPGQVFLMHLQKPPPTVASRSVEVSPAVEALIARCLEKNPDARFANGTELAAAIDAILQAEAPAIPPPIAVPIVLPPAPPPPARWPSFVFLALLVAGVSVAMVMAR